MNKYELRYSIEDILNTKLSQIRKLAEYKTLLPEAQKAFYKFNVTGESIRAYLDTETEIEMLYKKKQQLHDKIVKLNDSFSGSRCDIIEDYYQNEIDRIVSEAMKSDVLKEIIKIKKNLEYTVLMAITSRSVATVLQSIMDKLGVMPEDIQK